MKNHKREKEAFLSPIVTKSNNFQEIKYLYDMHNLKCVIGWNHKEFEVPYICLSDEIKIGKGGFQIKINFLVDKEMEQYV
jgi:hypothetical protein